MTVILTPGQTGDNPQLVPLSDRHRRQHGSGTTVVSVTDRQGLLASGALATMQQVGGAVGVAIIGIIFFGLIGHNAPVAAGHASTTASAAVTASGAPQAVSAQAAQTFQRCFADRVRSADPTITPPGCDVPAGASAGVARSYSDAAADATAHTFATSFAQAMWYQVAVYLLVLALLFRLPKVNPRQLAETDAAAAGGAAG